jgi:hypothetical protein
VDSIYLKLNSAQIRIPYEYAYLLCKRTAWVIRKDLVAMFGPRFLNDALDPSHPEYGCLLLDPLSNQKNVSIRRNSFAATTTMRQSNSHNQHHPYKRDFMRNTKTSIAHKSNSAILPRHHQHQNEAKAASNMSLSRLLNNQLSDNESYGSFDQEEHLKKSFTTADSPNTTPSPTFRVIPTFDHHNKWTVAATESNTTTASRLLPPIYTTTTSHTTAATNNDQQQTYMLKRTNSEPRITPIYSSCNSPNTSWSPISPVTSEASSTSSSSSSSAAGDYAAKDIIDTINATILLQRLSQDDGIRPFKPMHLHDSIPSKVMVGNQEFRICWDN